ncbi:MAG: hypothetical protein ACP5RQ_01540 [Candidatus Micrarchaeia archaeon]
MKLRKTLTIKKDTKEHYAIFTKCLAESPRFQSWDECGLDKHIGI